MITEQSGNGPLLVLFFSFPLAFRLEGGPVVRKCIAGWDLRAKIKTYLWPEEAGKWVLFIVFLH